MRTAGPEASTLALGGPDASPPDFFLTGKLFDLTLRTDPEEGEISQALFSVKISKQKNRIKKNVTHVRRAAMHLRLISSSLIPDFFLSFDLTFRTDPEERQNQPFFAFESKSVNRKIE
ncbi:hypothetical protein CEXT_423711 [Caerostris extrusa]|uniref:Uncharacterized protein n=1 Tax=Caerostris extrusa TaxID=172846 RepID=A0AAV4P781_CAEEX|nr:hypothetical protein CEXT_423711 [Caerostris extrusa]